MKVTSVQLQTYGVVLAFLSVNGLATRAQQTGFISIDCGSTTAYNDSVTGITWVPDTGYIDVGINVDNVAVPALTNNIAQFSTLRYFNESRSKYCYVLPVVAKSLYLIRQIYWYSSYDKAATPPIFNASIDSTDVFTINATDPNVYYTAEHLYVAVGSTISFCLYRSSPTGGNPFISSLELRLIDSTAYNDSNLNTGSLLKLYARSNYGGPLVRYPDDIYDRVWEASSSKDLTTLSTAENVTDIHGISRKPPMKVLETALSPTTVTNVTVNFPEESRFPECVTDLFFAEINANATVMSRLFNIDVPPYPLYEENIFNSSGGNNKADGVNFNWNLTATTTVTLIPIPGTVLPPLLSAAESWLVQPSTAPTYAADVTALEAFKANTSLAGCHGDPCLPVAFEWVACTVTSPPRITALILSNHNLSGPIPATIGDLTYLTNISLDNNMLTGPIPDLSSLTSLATLHLQNNGLTGSIPSSLGGLKSLTELSLDNNMLTLPFPDLSSLTSLATLSLDKNMLTGPIPDLSSLTSLATLSLDNNMLKGPIPDLSSLTSLATLSLGNNMLTGPIPDLSSLTSLATLHLQNNGLTGSIPSSLGGLKSLTELFLQNNKLSGVVPSSLQRADLKLNVAGNEGLNGLGPSPAPSGTPSPSSSNIGVIAGAAGGGVAAMLLIGGLIFFVCRCRKPKDGGDKMPIFTPNNTKDAVKHGPKTPEGSVQKQGAKAYSLREVRTATQNFITKIGEGGFGPVYYGKLADGQEVAIKVLDINSPQGAQEFNNEVDLLSRVHHRNLVSLVGYCQENNQQMLIYEFLHAGTVREHLYGSSKATSELLDWKMRLDIAVNAAQGMEYLHKGCSPSIIHRDIKSSNILLTNKYVAKVADFGLSKLAPEDSATHVSTLVKGTAGYLDPEYWSTNSLSEKSDVFSFGVVLLELVCGRVPIDTTLSNRKHWNICDFVRSMLQAGDIEKIMDPTVVACHPNMDSVWKVAEIAIQSVEPRGVHRPVMRDVVRELRDAITLEFSGGGTMAHLQGLSTDVHGHHSPHGGPPYLDISENSSTFESTLDPQAR